MEIAATDCKIKARTAVVLVVVGRVDFSRHRFKRPAVAFREKLENSRCVAPSPNFERDFAHHETA
jgi:hypothetical protein